MFVELLSIHEYSCPIIINTCPFPIDIFVCVGVIVKISYIHVGSDNRIAWSLQEQYCDIYIACGECIEAVVVGVFVEE